MGRGPGLSKQVKEGKPSASKLVSVVPDCRRTVTAAHPCCPAPPHRDGLYSQSVSQINPAIRNVTFVGYLLTAQK